jgi:hypothetical protein
MEGGRVHSYADPEYCQCLFLGSPNEFRAYSALARDREREEQEAIQGRVRLCR